MGNADLASSVPDMVRIIPFLVPLNFNYPYRNFFLCSWTPRRWILTTTTSRESSPLTCSHLSRTLLLRLPPLPPGNWVQARILRGHEGNLDLQLVHISLAQVCTHCQWHPNRVDILLLEVVKTFKNKVDVVRYEGRLVVHRLHALNVVHGDLNRYSFIIASDGTVTLIDLENTVSCNNPKRKDRELATLPSELTEETGRGKGRCTILTLDEHNPIKFHLSSAAHLDVLVLVRDHNRRLKPSAVPNILSVRIPAADTFQGLGNSIHSLRTDA
jgi:hypothetical protein